MYCTSCGSYVPDNQGVCPNCGAAVTPAQAQPVYQQPVYQQHAYQQPAYHAPVYTPVDVPRGNGLGTAGMVLGIVSTCISWIPAINVIVFVTGFLGLIFSIVGVCRRNVSGKGKAIAGIILSAIALVITFSMYYYLGNY